MCVFIYIYISMISILSHTKYCVYLSIYTYRWHAYPTTLAWSVICVHLSIYTYRWYVYLSTYTNRWYAYPTTLNIRVIRVCLSINTHLWYQHSTTLNIVPYACIVLYIHTDDMHTQQHWTYVPHVCIYLYIPTHATSSYRSILCVCALVLRILTDTQHKRYTCVFVYL